eukprot:CAMPEP_0116879064 /NCGR_PEP_ID=MMETSP0463-20121206/10812_1 /TAXON_ID=181622 /ORGANISM="Strombidinopsis sp, Strain SopsisLIS2011" /LENGTH=112 /DNA_ID=CAMNT_0004527907 /DNA_START=72 /DNA_END=410 /DNA_ORIENTATION=+
MLKALSATILEQGGIIRGFENLGDRVLTKNLKSQHGENFGIGRFIQVEFDGNPATKKLAEETAMSNPEVLRLFSLKMKERNYLDRIMKRLNSELSPFRDEESRDPVYVREMW